MAVLDANDIPGKNDVARGRHATSRCSPTDNVFYAGQPLAMVVATTLDAARHAAERATIEIEAEPAILDIDTALAAKAYVQAPQTLLRGDPDAAMKAAPHQR